MNRIGLDEYFMKMAFLVAERSTCNRHHVGAVSVVNKHVLTTGYNGAVAGLKDCLELGCLRKGIKSGTNIEVCRAVHAEQNILVQASLHGLSLEGAAVYCTHAPCLWCSKALANAKISRFIYCIDYEGRDIGPLVDSGVTVIGMCAPQLTIERKD